MPLKAGGYTTNITVITMRGLLLLWRARLSLANELYSSACSTLRRAHGSGYEPLARSDICSSCMWHLAKLAECARRRVIGWLRSGLRLLFPPENGCNARAPSLPHTRPPPNLGKLLSLPRFLQVPSTPTVTPSLTSVTHSSSPRNSRPSPRRRSPAAGHASVSITVSE